MGKYSSCMGWHKGVVGPLNPNARDRSAHRNRIFCLTHKLKDFRSLVQLISTRHILGALELDQCIAAGVGYQILIQLNGM